jgi:uncharacterized membrane-anchored protein
MKNIPKLNAPYWFLMLLCTAMGELIGNLISRNFELGYTQGALIDICVFAAAITCVFILRLKSDLAYWALILIGNIGGTNLADWVTLEPLAKGCFVTRMSPNVSMLAAGWQRKVSIHAGEPKMAIGTEIEKNNNTHPAATLV